MIGSNVPPDPLPATLPIGTRSTRVGRVVADEPLTLGLISGDRCYMLASRPWIGWCYPRQVDWDHYRSLVEPQRASGDAGSDNIEVGQYLVLLRPELANTTVQVYISAAPETIGAAMARANALMANGVFFKTYVTKVVGIVDRPGG